MPLYPHLYSTASNQQLFTELERLTLLCDNVRTTLDNLTIQENINPLLVQELRLYWSTQVHIKDQLRKFIINTRKA